MSFYATIQGTVRYSSQEAFDAAVAKLREGGWLMPDNRLVDECGDAITDEDEGENVDPGALKIMFPRFCYRNLAHILDDVVRNTEGTVTWTSTDGCADGGVFVDGVETTYKLVDWAKERGMVEPPDTEEGWTERAEWLDDVEMAFHDEM